MTDNFSAEDKLFDQIINVLTLNPSLLDFDGINTINSLITMLNTPEGTGRDQKAGKILAQLSKNANEKISIQILGDTSFYKRIDDDNVTVRKIILEILVNLTDQLGLIPDTVLKKDPIFSRISARLSLCEMDEKELILNFVHNLVRNMEHVGYYGEGVKDLISLIDELLKVPDDQVSILKNSLWSIVFLRSFNVPKLVDTTSIPQHIQRLLEVDNLQIKLVVISAIKTLFVAQKECHLSNVGLFYETLLLKSHSEIAKMTELPELEAPEEYFLYTSNIAVLFYKHNKNNLFCRLMSTLKKYYQASKEMFYIKINFYQHLIEIFGHLEYPSVEWNALRDTYNTVYDERRAERATVEDIHVNIDLALFEKISQDKAVKTNDTDQWNRSRLF